MQLPSSGQHRVNSWNAVSWCRHLHKEVGFHETRCRLKGWKWSQKRAQSILKTAVSHHQKSWIGHTASGGNNLATAAVQSFSSNHRIQNLELHVANGWNDQHVDIIQRIQQRHHAGYVRSSHSGPSLEAHWNPCTIDSLTVDNNDLSTCNPIISH